MAKQSKHYYDTSKYISLPMAIVGGVAILIILTLVGVKYSVFNGFLKTQVGTSPEGFVFENADGSSLTEEECQESYETCLSANPIRDQLCLDRAYADYLACQQPLFDCYVAYMQAKESCKQDERARPTLCRWALDECVERAKTSPSVSPLVTSSVFTPSTQSSPSPSTPSSAPR